MTLKYEGSVAWIFQDHFDVDQIIGLQNTRVKDVNVLIKLCMSAYEPDFAKNVKPGDIFVGGRNFGYGHAHPPAMTSVRAVGINIVLAESFAPGFYRGESSNGMVLLQVPGISKAVNRHDRLRVDFKNGIVENLTQKSKLTAIRPSKMVIDLVANGGSKGFLLKELEKLTP
ncbi:MAG: hypothetical protein ACQ5SW_13570 [Sphaerochaetaceae bacterium]